MDWQQIAQAADELIEAHPNLQPFQYAQMLQQQFRDQPMIGWFILIALEKRRFKKEKQEGNG